MSPVTASPTEPFQWSAQLARFSLMMAHPISAAGAWEHITGFAPEVNESRPREGYSREAGTFEGSLLEVQAGPTRLDIFMAPQAVEGASEGAPAAVLGRLERAVERWISTAPAIDADRVALGLIAVSPVGGKTAGYTALQAILPCLRLLDVENSSDLIYRINHPIGSHIALGLRYNRLTAWSILLQRVAVIGPDQGVKLLENPETDRFFVRLECDHNTPLGAATPVAHNLILPVFKELSELACENVARGEVL
jgi:hypothetical protein